MLLNKEFKIAIRNLKLCVFDNKKKANYGYRITNKKSILDENTKVNINKKCCFLPEDEFSFEV